MAKYIVTTQSVFEDRYEITASSKEEAIAFILGEEGDFSFYQKHLGEHATSVEEVSDDYDMHMESHKLGYC